MYLFPKTIQRIMILWTEKIRRIILPNRGMTLHLQTMSQHVPAVNGVQKIILIQTARCAGKREPV